MYTKLSINIGCYIQQEIFFQIQPSKNQDYLIMLTIISCFLILYYSLLICPLSYIWMPMYNFIFILLKAKGMSIRRPMTKKSNHPAPFSNYVLKSHSSEHSKILYQKQSDYLISKELNEYLTILQKKQNLFVQNIKNISAQFRTTEDSFKKNQPQKDEQKDKALNNEQTISSHVMVGIAPLIKKDRMRQKQNLIKLNSLSPVKKIKIVDSKKIISSLRYQIISLFSLFNKRQEYMTHLRGKQDSLSLPLTSNEIQEKLHRYEETKGRDRGRVKFNYLTNEQLRSLKYKSKNNTAVSNVNTMNNSSKKEEKQKIHYDQDEEDNDAQIQEKEEKMDYQTWRRRNGVGYNQRVFIIKGGYAELRRSLLDKGWYENQDVWSPYYDFKWTTRICDINFMTVRHTQGVNHFNNNFHLTSKYGITRRLKTLTLGFSIDADKFYPKCFDLGDQVDFENFVQNFKFSFSESVAKRFLIDKVRYKGLQLKIRITYQILKRRSLSFNNLIQSINKGKFTTITPDQWGIITETTDKPEEELKKKLFQLKKSQKVQLIDSENPEDEDYQANLYERMDEKMRKLLSQLKEKDPQFDINGMRNVWIAKPNFMSRGRGIRCFNNLYDIADYCLGQQTQFVVQKYIENPLLIEGRKFDIRQWVLIQNFNPPRIWFYQQCYLRFTNDQYDLDNIYNRFAHLTNNSIQKHSKNHNADKSMWELKELKQYIGEQKWNIIQQKIQNIIVWSVKSCEGYVLGKKGSAQLVGYDFMIDQNLNPWLIEVNMSPSMDYSTAVTKKLVKQVLQDTGRVISSSKKSKNYGSFTCIYQGNQDLPNFNLYNI